MKLRRSYFDSLDPELELTREQRRQINRKAIERFNAQPAVKLFLGVAVLIAICFGLYGVRALGASVTAIAAIVMGGCIGFGFGYLWRRHHSRATWTALREAGVDVCTHCGQWLRGLGSETTKCPECGGIRKNAGHAQSELPMPPIGNTQRGGGSCSN